MTNSPQNVTPEDETADEVPTWLRLLVVGLGIAIIVMLALIVGTILKRTVFAPDDMIGEDTVDAAVQPHKIEPIEDLLTPLEVPIPSGARYISSTLSGATLLLEFRSDDGDTVLLLVDRQSGQVQTVRVTAEDSAPSED